MIGIASVVGVFLLAGASYAAFFMPTMRLNVLIDGIEVGNLSREEALVRVQEEIHPLLSKGFTVVIDGRQYLITAQAINLSYDVPSAINTAWGIGRSGDVWMQAQQRVTTLVQDSSITIPVYYDENALQSEIERIASMTEIVPKDVRLVFEGTTVSVADDIASGRTFDHIALHDTLVLAFSTRNPGPFSVTLAEQTPSGTVESAQEAQAQAKNVLKSPLVLAHDKDNFLVSTTTLASWLESTTYQDQVDLTFKTDLIKQYIAELDAKLNIAPREPVLTVENGHVVSFTPPRNGKALNQTDALDAIITELTNRFEKGAKIHDITLQATVTKPVMTDPVAKEYGIQELIGTGTTTFNGSPSNRIWNIKTGAGYLNNHLLAPGQEFSTTSTLGDIDASTGYKQELVIKDNRTIPEYGGGLCQVSTTLFRAILDTGLPVTARTAHAYRVSYYEKDGNGLYIGPGLDATIYSPNPDFRFKNDTPGYILITSNVVGSKITFSLYGTDDGRTANVDGPYILSTTPAGKPVYIETDTLKPGEEKQVEYPHGGGTATATYTVRYADGTVQKKVFNSKYKNWPATFLVGKEPDTTTDTTTPTPDSTTPANENVLSQDDTIIDPNSILFSAPID
ncbi:MAG: VanW family protein [bacterium]|nr:VanW family protein [bacterium]